MDEQRPSKDLAGELKSRSRALEDGGYLYSAELMVNAAAEIERLQQCHREGWNYAKEVEDEYERRTGRRFGTAQPPSIDPLYTQEIINELSEARSHPELATWQLLQKALGWISVRSGLVPTGTAQPPGDGWDANGSPV